MAALAGDSSNHGVHEAGAYMISQEMPEESGGRWYFSRKEIEENSPSRLDGIDLKKETYLRKSYCTFLQDLGMRLKVPQVTIATAIIFCHRFFLRQSHVKNDRRTIATVCMFLAGKVEETPRPLKDVIMVSYEIIHKKDPDAKEKIRQKELYEQQKELTLIGERVVLVTLGFDLNVHHPYKPLVEAIKKFKVAQNALAQVAWNFVNDGLRTSLCLQFKPHHIAAGAIFLAAKFLKVKLPSDGEKVWWQEFDVTPRQLEEVSNQMLELYEQNKAPPSQASEAEGSVAGSQRPVKSSATNEDLVTNNSNSQGGGPIKAGPSKPASHRPTPDLSHADNNGGPPRGAQDRSHDFESAENNSDHFADGETSGKHSHERELLPHQGSGGEIQNRSKTNPGSHGEEDRERNAGRTETRDKVELKDKYHGRALERKDGAVGQSPQEVIKKIDKDKVKAALERNRKSRGDSNRKVDYMDEDDLIERELEDGIELPAESEKNKRERKQSWSKSSIKSEHESSHQDGVGDGQHQVKKEQPSRNADYDNNVEEGELDPYDDIDRGYHSPRLSNRKRKATSPPTEGKQRYEYGSGTHNHTYHDFPEDRNTGKIAYSERDHKRHVQENHV
nr:cyclin-T1-4-like [Ipomoea batatas]GME17323.1 cyclin-T1-4-like [Ipomoea batatas]